MEPICCPETSVTNYRSTPRKIPEGRRSHLYRDESLKSRTENSDLRGFIHSLTDLMYLETPIRYYSTSIAIIYSSEGKRPLGRPRRRWEDNIKMDLREVGGGCGDWMELAQDRDRWRALVSTVRNLRIRKMRGIS